MKIKNILFSLFVIIGTLFTTTVKAATTAPSSFVINDSDTYLLYGSEILGHGSTLNFTYKVNADGKIVYCTEIHDSMTSTSEKYTYSKEMDAKIAYVLEHGYPNVSITGNKNKDYYITGVALWYLLAPNDSSFYYFDLANGTYKGYSSDVVREIAKLVNGAKAYSYTNPTIKINTASNNLKLSSDGKYYVSSSMGVKTTGSIVNKTYTVSLESAPSPSGTIVTDASGKEKTTFGTNEAFLVKVPASSIKNLSAEFKVNVSATGSINKAYLYLPGNSAHQNLAALYPEKKDVKDSTTLKLNIVTEIQIRKTDAATGEELPGAKLTVKDANGKVVDSWVSTDEPHVIKGLKPGKYSLTEEIAPEGYIKSEETIEFEVKSDGSVTKVTMENKREEKMPVYISKQDVTTGEELPGAHLELKDEKGNLIEAWISGDEPHEVKELKPGKYYLSETLAPEGYELTTEVVEFTIKEDGTVDGKVIMYNKPETYIPVPNTSSFKTITASLIGIIVIGLGSVILYRNYKKNEEN